ncbi:ABC transporter ATP-binding protein [Jiangella anatolica]|uniref:Dipeptide ABC transporter ATP-binding protein DppD n=1 Tax=Jiangella anatolica TaxID=2670374 RepID=A0A2W2C408_9ACTN|nr:ABC transporter ATP-binding protein [Jiangella anatolica]PZF86688.1 dipeptide ABC transporter ATP-binding protein DppD [Jiangella anatolica]
MTEPLLSIDEIVTEFRVEGGVVRAVNGVSLDVRPGETVGVVGESGSGKSVTMMSALGLLPGHGRVVAGHARFRGRDLVGLAERELERIRGREIGLVFQDPMTAFNPVMTVGEQIAEGLRRHQAGLSRRAAGARVVELLAEVGIPAPERRARQYPHEFSGGMRQRAMIAMAMANRPALIIADEPTTALDVTIQAQILDLLGRVQQETEAALIMITHDLGVIAEMTERVVVMYAGRVVETADVDTVFHEARHPYTRGLLRSLPRLDHRVAELPAIGGQPPNPQALPPGCSYRPRCPLNQGRDECLTRPELNPAGRGHRSACHFHAELAGLTGGVE